MKYKFLFTSLMSLFILAGANAGVAPLPTSVPDNSGIRPINIQKTENAPEIKSISVARGVVNAKRDKSKEPLVVIVHGLDSGKIGFILEFRHIKFLLSLISSNQKMVRSGMTPTKARGFIADAAKLEAAEAGQLYDYFEEMMDQAKTYTGINAEVVKMEWSRDPGDTAFYVKKIKKDIMEVYARAEAENRPFHIIAFSWGSVILYEVLTGLYNEGQSIYVDKFVTLGSPLIPSGFLAQVFLFIEIVKEQLSVMIEHPKNVGQWINLYADNDSFSGHIPHADKNTQVDKGVVSLVTQISQMENVPKAIRKQDIKDLQRTMLWHMCYFYNVHVPLQSVLTPYHQDLIREYSPVYLGR